MAIVTKDKLDETSAKFDNPCSQIYSLSPPDATSTLDILISLMIEIILQDCFNCL